MRPWIIGFSGGKDSTTLLQLLWLALKNIPHELRNRMVYVVCNDTLVENHVITEYVFDVILKIQQSAVEQGLPIEVQKTIHRLEDTFGAVLQFQQPLKSLVVPGNIAANMRQIIYGLALVIMMFNFSKGFVAKGYLGVEKSGGKKVVESRGFASERIVGY